MRSEELLPVPEANELSSTVSCPVVGTAGSLHPPPLPTSPCQDITLPGHHLSPTV